MHSLPHPTKWTHNYGPIDYSKPKPTQGKSRVVLHIRKKNVARVHQNKKVASLWNHCWQSVSFQQFEISINLSHDRLSALTIYCLTLFVRSPNNLSHSLHQNQNWKLDFNFTSHCVALSKVKYNSLFFWKNNTFYIFLLIMP